MNTVVSTQLDPPAYLSLAAYRVDGFELPPQSGEASEGNKVVLVRHGLGRLQMGFHEEAGQGHV